MVRLQLALLLMLSSCAVLVRSGHILDPDNFASCAARWRSKCIPWTVQPSEFWEEEERALKYLRKSVEHINERLADTEDGVQLVEIDYEDIDNYRYIIRVAPTKYRDSTTNEVIERSCSAGLGRANPRDAFITTISCRGNTPMHEMLHALGLAHEHQRVDRDEHEDKYYDEKIAAIPFPRRRNYLKYSETASFGWPRCVPHGDYDRRSTMMYSNVRNGVWLWEAKSAWELFATWGPKSDTKMSDGDAAALEAVLKPCTKFEMLADWEDLGACHNDEAILIGAGVAGAAGLGAAGMYVKRRSDQNKQVRETKRAEKRAARRQHRVGGGAVGSTGSRLSRKAERLGSVSRGSVGSRSRSKGRRSTAGASGSNGSRVSSTKA